jgi:glycosyltransferase involved in cell wall biosynthesis
LGGLALSSSAIQQVSGVLPAQGARDNARVLFLHAALDHLSAEYKVHKVLGEGATAYGVDSYFIWQRGARRTGDNNICFQCPERVSYIDFGNDRSQTLYPDRLQRKLTMMRRLFPSLLATIDYVRRIRPDVIYTSQQRYDVSMGSFIGRLFGIPHVIHLHYNIGPWLGRSTLRTIQRSRHLIAVSEFIRQNALLQEISPSVVHTVPNSIGCLPALKSVDRAAMRAEFGWERDAPVLIAAGRLDPMKNHVQLVEIFSSVLAHMPAARLLICGRTLDHSTAYPDLLRRRVAELGIGHAVVFAGHRYDLPDLMRGSDAFALLSELEPFGLVFLEAMSLELPVAAYCSGAVPEIVVDGTTGLLSYPEQPEVLIQNILCLLFNRSLSRQMGVVGRQRVADRFPIDRIASLWATFVRSWVSRLSLILAWISLGCTLLPV